MDSVSTYFSEELFFNDQVTKRLVTQGSGQAITQNCKLLLSEQIFSDSSKALLHSSDSKLHKIIQYPESSTIPPYDAILLTLNEGDEVWVKFPYTLHSYTEACWETIWYHIKVLSVDFTPDLLSLPQYISFLREHRLGPEKSVIKRVICEGSGNTALVNSRVLFSYEMILENGCIIESQLGKSYTLTRNISPGMHKGVHLALYTMRTTENALILLKPGFHACEKFKENDVWARIVLENIEFSKELLYPQHQPYLEEVILKDDSSVLKRIVKYGQGPYLEGAAKVWVELTGRLEDGYLFQKPKEEVFALNGGKIYSEAVVLGISSMKRGEIAWIRAAPDTHLYKEGYENEALWFLFTVKEYLEPYEKVLPQMKIEEKIELSSQLLEIAKRLFSSGTKRECKVIYNDIVTALKLKKDGFVEIPEELKGKFVDVRGRAMMNVSLMLLKEVEGSEKEDLKIKTAQKVLEFCAELIKYDPINVKAYYRRAQSYLLKKENGPALENLEKVLELDPKNKEAQNLIKKIKSETKKTESKEKKIYKGIFNGNKWLEEGEKEEADHQKRLESEEKTHAEWLQHQKLLTEEEQKRKLDYESALTQLEKGVIIDTADMTDPITDMFLIDS